MAEGSPMLPLQMTYTHDPETNTHILLYTSNHLMYDGKTEVAEVALTRKSLEAISEDSKVVIISVPQVLRMSKSAQLEYFKQ